MANKYLNYSTVEGFNYKDLRVMRDERTGVSTYTRGPKYIDLFTILNYMMMIDRDKANWTNYGYLDLGLIPLVIEPQISENNFKSRILPVALEAGLDVRELPGMSMTRDYVKGLGKELWVTRESANSYLGTEDNRATTKGVYCKLLREQLMTILTDRLKEGGEVEREYFRYFKEYELEV